MFRSFYLSTFAALLFVPKQEVLSDLTRSLGCYRATVTSQGPGRTPGEELPRYFRLKTENTYSGDFVIEELDRKKAGSWWTSSWHPNSNGTITLVWGAGFEGYILELKPQGDRYSGTAQFWTDDAPLGAYAKLNVEVQPVFCELHNHSQTR